MMVDRYLGLLFFIILNVVVYFVSLKPGQVHNDGKDGRREIRGSGIGMQRPPGSTSQVTKVESVIPATSLESKKEVKTEEERALDCSKFKKVEMLVFDGTDPDSWLFRADCYFKIHNLLDSEKLTVAVISFDGPALDFYRSQEEREAFKGWDDLKQKMLV
ncbi:transposon Tf2-1 polyprotein isoform X1 [Cucumis melo var. makuwa]|uniref:Transposon Tf2-1 polyprotein isoform X1 n=1 Tax=Cucumis melo var. makuwa TaxID=1194695 RepID=A0A5A7V343_CUCMM|nr:transposon Tf2-1 polyprotein isoform X1 [Cucumis melo var. makuwa]TYK21160.1 transposon Tf2-1 polyprotein isoform X1 [Cucumis melo var. makuwa]